ncbi:Fe-S protein assembly chaperone HscA, partial [Klebsiella pneumoniae]
RRLAQQGQRVEIVERGEIANDGQRRSGAGALHAGRSGDQAIDAAAEQVRAAAAGDDADAIKEAIKNIDTQTQEFAARRMDQSVRIALKGQSVDEV